MTRYALSVMLFVGLGPLTFTVSASDAPLQRIAFGSCAGEDAPQPIWEHVLEAKPDLWIWAGDNIYGDTDDMNVMRDKYAKLAAVPGYADLVQSGIPILATWDDHDYGRNDAGADYPFRAESQDVFLDFFGVSKTSPRRSREGIYHSEIIGPEGKQVQIILLDTRYHRSSLDRYPPPPGKTRGPYRPNTDPDATVLGDAQWKWLREQLRKPAELRLIVSSIQVISPEHIYEKWNNFPRERQRLLSLISETQAEGVIFLSGDRHHAELSRLSDENPYPLYDLTSSGINKSRPPRPNDPPRDREPNPYRVGKPYRGHHFGLLEINWNHPDPILKMSIVDANAQHPIEIQTRLGNLRFSN